MTGGGARRIRGNMSENKHAQAKGALRVVGLQYYKGSTCPLPSPGPESNRSLPFVGSSHAYLPRQSPLYFKFLLH